VSRAALILFICIALPASLWPKPGLAAGFDTAAAATVWAAALSYIAPRALEPLTVPQMAIWGLNGLTALDPDLNAIEQDSQIRLYGPNQLLIAVPSPPAGDAKACGRRRRWPMRHITPPLPCNRPARRGWWKAFSMSCSTISTRIRAMNRRFRRRRTSC
jgi:hypothetical protein